MDNPLRGDNEITIEKSIGLGGCLLVLKKKRTAGICGTSWMTYDGRRIYLHHFAIAEKYQGIGLSKPLMHESFKFIKRKGVPVKLEVHRNNLKATGIYKKAGFVSLGDYKVFIIRDIENVTI